MLAVRLHHCARPLVGSMLLIVGALIAGGSAGRAEPPGPIKSRNLDTSRTSAATMPRSEADQAVVGGWPVYRTPRGQQAFNDAMATLAATEATAPTAPTFARCPDLACPLVLPTIGADGWIPAGRLWVSPTEYVVIAHSPRSRRADRRRSVMAMRHFVFHEFHNSSRNTDPYDTISSHSGAVFVPFYLSRTAHDARGRAFVVIVQVAPYDVVSVHASNLGSAGPGVEVARNAFDTVEPLQNTAGILLALMARAATPRLDVVNHRGNEGRPMLEAYLRHVDRARRTGGTAFTVPFVPARADRVARVDGGLETLLAGRTPSRRLALAERRFTPPPAMPSAAAPAGSPSMVRSESMRADQPPALPPLAAYLQLNLALMKRHPAYAGIVPASVTAIAAERDGSAVYLLDDDSRLLGRIVADAMPGHYRYEPSDGPSMPRTFGLDVSRPLAPEATALSTPFTLLAPAQHVPRPACAAAVTSCRADGRS